VKEEKCLAGRQCTMGGLGREIEMASLGSRIHNKKLRLQCHTNN